MTTYNIVVKTTTGVNAQTVISRKLAISIAKRLSRSPRVDYVKVNTSERGIHVFSYYRVEEVK